MIQEYSNIKIYNTSFSHKSNNFPINFAVLLYNFGSLDAND